MAKQTLPAEFQDDIMNNSMGGRRRYRIINNSDGTISFEDATIYEQVGSNFGAGQINAINQAVNESFDKNKIVKDLETIGAITEEGYVPDSLALKELNNSLNNCIKFLNTSSAEISISGGETLSTSGDISLVQPTDYSYYWWCTSATTSSIQAIITGLGNGGELRVYNKSTAQIKTTVKWYWIGFKKELMK